MPAQQPNSADTAGKTAPARPATKRAADGPAAPDFVPPRFSPAFWRFISFTYPVTMPLKERVTRLRISDAHWARLEALRGKRALLLCNHPTETEPQVMVGLSAKLREPFYYAATLQLFQGAFGALMQRMGVFSIRRGAPDRKALKMCQELLLEKNAKVVLFPEGDYYWRNNALVPFSPGIAQIAFWCLEHLAERVEGGAHAANLLPIVPVAVKYRFTGDPLPRLLAGTARLERALGLTEGEAVPATLPERLLRAADTVFAGMERDYNFGPDAGKGTLAERATALYDYIERRGASVMRLPPMKETLRLLRSRDLFMSLYAYRDGHREKSSEYGQRLNRGRKEMSRWLYDDLMRMHNLFSIAEFGVGPFNTAEQAGEMLNHLEFEVFGRHRTRLWREAIVGIAEPVQFADWLPRYKEDRRAAVAEATDYLETVMQNLLDSLAGEATPIPGAGILDLNIK